MALISLSPDAAARTFRSGRIQSIDLIRGAVMVLMAIDHVRVYSGLPAGGHTPGIFFTRWITHFCVPAFVFFAGTSAFLNGKKIDDKRELAHYLLVRGLILVLLELTVIRLCWTFNFNHEEFVLAGVIWMLGWCMVLMSAIIWLPDIVTGILGLAIIFLQQLFKYPPKHFARHTGFGRFWEFFYPAGTELWPCINILYTLIPWIGVMAAGYAFGRIMMREPAFRNRICLILGLSTTVLYLVIGGYMVLSAPASSDAPPALFRLLAQNKYPASQLYLMMTLGPTIALLPFAEKVKGWFADVLLIFGRVPMFYYLLHILLIHVSALIVNFIRTGDPHAAWYATAPYTWISDEQRWSLPLLYATFAIDVLILYFACRWYANYKFNHPAKQWLKYF